ncbi:HAD-IIB family hydrolase [Thalassotalea agarivorans]|uniref:Mannosyl-3-phosphoglycerate phosphatase n=1 Tax=Thalassotalea agarivorans TaxID=349064 RepID=A0A1H9ZK38_THASX|nr:HAD-IIB family hydrolase [Thalassotalea agarivorans]SES81882.1 mannosyl-3-phosphoglycerate phosphatase [Thalassotalea agarivorans]
MNETPLIFTDLDGTLLDHFSYSFDAAKSTLSALKSRHIPVIPTTSKTAPELEELMGELSLSGPFIIENGAAIYMPEGYFPNKPQDAKTVGNYWVIELVEQAEVWRDIVSQLTPDYPELFTQFSQMSVENIAMLTELSHEKAALASQRGYGEPVFWQGTKGQLNQFIEDINKRGANVLIGGRFIHVSGRCNKGRAMLKLAQEYKNQYPGETFFTLATGDGENDVDMLNMSDIAGIIKSPVHKKPTLSRTEDVLISNHFGPAGWAEVVHLAIPNIDNAKERKHG